MANTSNGDLLAITDVSVADPTHQPQDGQVWQVGPHRLVIADVFCGWPVWAPLLHAGCVFLPNPGPYMLVSNLAASRPLVCVQPDTYLAGHLLDKYAAVHGPHKIRLLGDQALEVLAVAA